MKETTKTFVFGAKYRFFVKKLNFGSAGCIYSLFNSSIVML